MGASFVAAFVSECEDCGTTIYEGDLAGYVDDLVCCEDCWTIAEEDE